MGGDRALAAFRGLWLSYFVLRGGVNLCFGRIVQLVKRSCGHHVRTGLLRQRNSEQLNHLQTVSGIEFNLGWHTLRFRDADRRYGDGR